MPAPRLGPDYRTSALRRLADDEFDVLVIGDGVVGAGAALDAASRGFSVALVDAWDWGACTCSMSSKLIHGGLRYLEQLDFKLVFEALEERRLLLNRLAPHLVRPVSLLFPLRHRVRERAYAGGGVLLYDLIDRTRQLPPHHLSRVGVLRGARTGPARHGRRYPVPRGPGRRRASHHGAGPHRRPVRRDGAHRGAGDRTGPGRGTGLAAPHLGWDTERERAEIVHYSQRVEAERAAQQAAGDHAANAARLAAGNRPRPEQRTRTRPAHTKTARNLKVPGRFP
ncbi:FAD-dependent oxidoreductase [Nocardia otitidiscaviarum]|uniref:FAD-dependent oxidoreductase n=1 Tax=Nocardia otitidiscaviarum TaxID=1823 RepID=UPI000AA2E425|nr:FAD-dependent oxidoreductase [Nocardia otitidiscaviarum]